MRVNCRKNRMFHGITVSLTRRKIQKCQQNLGNGHDAELHLTIAELYRYLQEDSLAIESYKLAAETLLKKRKPGDTESSNQLIKIYKNILSLTPLDDETAEKLSQEYQRRGMDYRAVSVHTSFAEHYTQLGEYTKAIEHYQRIFEIEPGSITARQICADLCCRIGDPRQGSREYSQIGDIHFEHQKFDDALKYYQQASKVYPDDDDVKQKILMTRQILEGTVIPQVQTFTGRKRTD
jgi:tetratricopeptide (TPR) repeat protein